MILKKIVSFFKKHTHQILDLIMVRVYILFSERKKNDRYLEAVTVCVNYSHFLEIAISNRIHFDKWYIVTIKEDSATIDLCRKYNLECVLTKRLYENGDPFNKGKAINDGLKIMKQKDWIMHIDADTILPGNFREVFLRHKMGKKNIYTCMFRAHCPDEQGYHIVKEEMKTSKKNIIDLYPQLNEDIILQEQENRNQYCMNRLKIDGLYRDSSIDQDDATRLKSEWFELNKHTIILEKNDFKAGFVQLFHSSENKFYSESFGSADSSDSDFFLKFHEIRDESEYYKGSFSTFKIRNWKYIEVPFGFGRSRQEHMICFHIGDSYKNWDGI